MDNITVKLQNPFSYAVWPIVLLALIVIGLIVALIILKLNKNRKKAAPPVIKEEPKPVNVVDKGGIKNKYLKQLDELEQEFAQKNISIRKAYQSMSIIARRFVQEMTGIKVKSYTLSDIKALNMPTLENLIGEFYSPEFSTKSEGDVMESIAKTRRIIKEWN